jgi:RecA-family ATPase
MGGSALLDRGVGQADALSAQLAEQALIGALLTDNSVYPAVRHFVSAGDFYSADNRQIWGAIEALVQRGELADLITLPDELLRAGDGSFNADAGVEYLARLAQNAPPRANVARYAAKVRTKAIERKLGAKLLDTTRRLGEGHDFATLLAELRADVAECERARGGPNERALPLDWKALAEKGDPPTRRWVDEGWVGLGHPALVVGAPGAGKSHLLQNAGTHWCLGRKFLGEVPAAHKVLIFNCEDEPDELWRRQSQIAASLKLPLSAFADKLFICARHGLDNALVDVTYGKLMMTPLLGELREMANDLAVRVVILDNIAHLFGGNENDRHHVTVFVNAVAGALPGCAVILVGHPARSIGSEFSGSSAWEAVTRTRLYLGSHLPDQKPAADEEPDDDVRYLARRKANYSAKDWRRFTFRAGVLVPDSVDPSSGMVAVLRERGAERVVLHGLQRLIAMKLDASEASSTRRYLPTMLLEFKLNEGMSKAELAQAMRRLMTSGAIMRAEIGRYANRAPKFGLTPVE